MCEIDDVFQVIPNGDLPKLREKYSEFLPRTAYVYNFLSCIIKWKKRHINKDYVTIMAPYGNYEDGTFIAIQTWSFYELFVFTLDENYDNLYKSLTSTKIVEWKKLLVLYAVQKNAFPTVVRALQEVEFPIHHSNVYGVWWMSKENALELNIEYCPSEVYVKQLDKIHAPIINSHWDSRFPDSEQYLSTLIELNGGYGAFLKSDNELIAWILKNQIGLGTLQTLDGYKRKGYGSLITKHIANKIAKDGEDPLGTVLQTNSESQAMFRKLGFVIVETVVFTEANITL